jgi:tRNA(Ser,Leu) C12 N-acetylase TAN1
MAVTGVRRLDSWNVLATAREFQQRRLLGRLRAFGAFQRTRFLGVLVGQVADVAAFLEELRRREEARPGFLAPLARVVPIELTFEFSLEDFPKRLTDAALGFAERIDSGSFHVRLERRGHLGQIHTRQLEQHVGQALFDALAARGQEPRVDFTDPDLVIVVETLDDECGVGAIPRALRVRYPFVHAP